MFRLTLGKPGMVVARALVDPALADELRDSCMSVALALGGWAKPAKSIQSRWRILKMLVGVVGIELKATLKTRKLLILLNEKNAKNT